MTENNNFKKYEGVIMPLSYLPSIDHYCYIVGAPSIVFEVNETFPKQTCRNRTVIYTANGTLRLTIPVVKPLGNASKTSDILIDKKTLWNKIHWKAISSAYSKSPFFLYYKDELEQIFHDPGNLLVEFNIKLIQKINEFLKIRPICEYSKEYLKVYDSLCDIRLCSKDISLTDHYLPSYNQVFSDRLPYIANLSILDLLFNEGPLAVRYLKNAPLKAGL